MKRLSSCRNESSENGLPLPYVPRSRRFQLFIVFIKRANARYVHSYVDIATVFAKLFLRLLSHCCHNRSQQYHHHHHHHQLCEWVFFHQQLFLIVILKDVLWSSLLKILSMDAFLVVVALISLALFTSKIPVACWILSTLIVVFLCRCIGSSQHHRSVLTTALHRSRQKQ